MKTSGSNQVSKGILNDNQALSLKPTKTVIAMPIKNRVARPAYRNSILLSLM